MMDEENDEIAEWAKNLTPEGSPGKMGEYMRSVLGDQRYEEELEYHGKVRQLMTDRIVTINGLFNVAVILLSGFGLVGFVAAVAATAKFIF